MLPVWYAMSKPRSIPLRSSIAGRFHINVIELLLLNQAFRSRTGPGTVGEKKKL